MLSKSKNWVQMAWRWLWRPMGRWWIVSLCFWVGGLGLLYAFISLLKMPLMIGTLFAAEITVVLRFLINDRWVFGYPRPSWSRLWQFHLACAGGAAIWWCVANALPRFGVYYLIASAAGSAASVLFSMTTNFRWIWRSRSAQSSAAKSTVVAESVRSARAD